MKRAIARLVDAALNLYAPLVHARTYEVFTTDMVGASRLADFEADRDVLEPWEQELVDAYDMDDAQWAARQRHLHAVHDDLPAGAGAAMTPPSMPRPAQPAPAGSPDPVATVIAVVLRGQGIHSSAIYADLITRELNHHFTIHPK